MPRSAPPPPRAPRARAGSRRGSPPVLALHCGPWVIGLPEVGGEVLPAPVGEYADDDGALVLLAGEAEGDVDDRAGGDAREDALAIEERPDAGDGVLVRDEDLAVDLRDVEDRR